MSLRSAFIMIFLNNRSRRRRTLNIQSSIDNIQLFLKEGRAMTSEIMTQADQVIAKTYKRFPMVLANGNECTVHDTDGRSYTDFVACSIVKGAARSAWKNHGKPLISVRDYLIGFLHNCWCHCPTPNNPWSWPVIKYSGSNPHRPLYLLAVLLRTFYRWQFA